MLTSLPMILRKAAQRFGFGKWALALWHQPIGRLGDIIAAGGPLVMRETKRGRLEMETAAANLPPLPEVQFRPCSTVHVLTGRQFWFQTAFCLHSFATRSQTALEVEIYDDGSLDVELRKQITKFAPHARLHLQPEIVERLDRYLPESTFPALRERWRNYPNIRKLIDPHLGSTGWKLVIDSDILFFRRPDYVLNWLDAPDRPLHAVDSIESYGYPRDLLEKLAGASLPQRVNVGLCGLRSENLDWNEMERWCRALSLELRPSYYLEQALVAMLAAGQKCAVAPVSDYVTLPRPPEAVECHAVMHHYVAGSKRWYFQHNWRRSELTEVA